MSQVRAKELIELGNTLFLAKGPLDTLCQELAENCYPERADFTVERTIGDDFAAHLSDSYPVLARRELGNSFSSILRPRDKDWFGASTLSETLDNDATNARFLEYLSSETRSAIYDPRTDMIGATKMADHDFATFGQGILSIEEVRSGPLENHHLFYRPHHFRDVAWLENDIGVIDHLHRKDRMTARAMRRKFGDKRLHQIVRTACEKNPGQKFNIRVVVMPADEYDYICKSQARSRSKNEDGGDVQYGEEDTGERRGRRLPFVIVYIDADNCKILREGGLSDFIYMVARWHRIPGFQYAFSPAAMTALPDARMAQELALLILEAGERSIYPPTMANQEAITQANLQAGSLTWVDIKEGRVQDAMASLAINADMKVAFGMRQDLRAILDRSWFLDKLRMPEPGTQRTAYEVARMIEDHVRNLLPLFEPMEVEYNTKLLDKSFQRLVNMKRFDWSQIPDQLRQRGRFDWRFKNPMQEASSRILVSQFGEVLQLIKAAQEFGLQSMPIHLNTALENAIRGTSAPATWRKTPQEQEQEAKMAELQRKIMGAAQEVAGAAQVADQVGKGAESLQRAGILPAPQQQQQLGGQRQLPAPRLGQRNVASSLPTFEPSAVAA